MACERQWLRHEGSRVGLSSGLSGCSCQALQHGLMGCGVQTWLPCCLWDLPGSGIETVSPALAGGFFTTEPPGKPSSVILNIQRNLRKGTAGGVAGIKEP